MSNATIVTDHKWKQFKYGYEVPKKVLADQYEHLDDAESQDGFIYSNRRWLHTSDFMRISEHSPFRVLNYDGYFNDTAFSGYLIKLSPDGEGYQIAYFYS